MNEATRTRYSPNDPGDATARRAIQVKHVPRGISIDIRVNQGVLESVRRAKCVERAVWEGRICLSA
ncbi:MAG TPA: hypothetical protein VGN31_15215, partial [Paraburkholderia sp.]